MTCHECRVIRAESGRLYCGCDDLSTDPLVKIYDLAEEFVNERRGHRVERRGQLRGALPETPPKFLNTPVGRRELRRKLEIGDQFCKTGRVRPIRTVKQLWMEDLKCSGDFCLRKVSRKETEADLVSSKLFSYGFKSPSDFRGKTLLEFLLSAKALRVSSL